MIIRLKNTFLLYINQLWQILSIIAGAWSLGMVIMYSILISMGKLDEPIMNVGLLLASIIGAMSVLAVTFVFYAIHFNIAVSMGASRKQFLLESSLVLFAQSIIHITFIFVLGSLELLIAKTFFKGAPLDSNLIKLDLNMLLFLLGGAIAIIAIGIFVGALLHRFGRTAFWILWGIYMFFAFGGVGLRNLAKSQDSGILGDIVNTCIGFLSGLTPVGMLTIFAVLCTILAVAGVLIFRKAPVK